MYDIIFPLSINSLYLKYTLIEKKLEKLNYRERLSDIKPDSPFAMIDRLLLNPFNTTLITLILRINKRFLKSVAVIIYCTICLTKPGIIVKIFGNILRKSLRCMVVSRVMRKIVCGLWQNKISQQSRHPPG